jgi:hypothetical protein
MKWVENWKKRDAEGKKKGEEWRKNHPTQAKIMTVVTILAAVILFVLQVFVYPPNP